MCTEDPSQIFFLTIMVVLLGVIFMYEYELFMEYKKGHRDD